MRFFIVFFLLALTLFSKAQVFTPVDSQSKITFKIKNFGVSVEGSLSGLKGTIAFDPSNISTGKFDVTIEAASINTGINVRDKHLKKEEYFDVVKFPLIKFTSTVIKAVKSNSYMLTGNLTIKETTKEISFPFIAEKQSDGYLFKGEFIIDRREYNVGGNSMTMADELTLFLSVKVQDKKRK